MDPQKHLHHRRTLASKLESSTSLNLCIHHTIIDIISACIIRLLTSSIGEYNQFKRLTSTLTADDVLSYFIAKALLASLIGNHLMLSVFILDQGYPIRIDRGLPNILHECLQVCLDYQCASIVSLLHSKGVDINKQV